MCLREVLEGVFLDEGEEGGIECIGLLQRSNVLLFKEEVFVLVQVDEDKAEDLAEVEAGDHFLKGLLAGAWGVFVDLDVIGGAGEDEMLVVKGTVFAIDGHGHVGG